jgi:plastocyanin
MKRMAVGGAPAGLAATCVLGMALVSGCGKPGTKVPISEMTAKTDAQGVQVVDMDVHSFYFKPSRVIVSAGKPVELKLHFKSFFIPHNFTCMAEEAGIAVSRGAGFMSLNRTKHVRFTPTRPGEYEFFCHVGNHHKKGMEGTLVVR